MAFAAVVDLCLHLHSFRNVDLFHQGLYKLRFRAYQDLSESPGGIALPKASGGGGSSSSSSSAPEPKTIPNAPPPECTALVPYNLLPVNLLLSVAQSTAATSPLSDGQPLSSSQQRVPQLLNKVDYHSVSPARIDADTQTFFSRSFLIRYCDEEVALDEACCFRLEIDLCRPGALAAPIYLEVDLLFADNSQQQLQQQQQQQQRKQQRQSSPGDDTFASPLLAAEAPPAGPIEDPEYIAVSYQIFRLNFAVKGILEALPIVFDEFHFAVCACTVHTLLVDIRQRFRFVPSPLCYLPRHRLPRAPLTLSYGKLGTEESRPTAYLPASQPRLARTFSDIIPPLRTVDQFIREGHRALPAPTVEPREPPPAGPPEWLRRAEQLHQFYTEMLLQSHLRLMCVYHSLCLRCLNENERRELRLDNEPMSVTLPGEQNILHLPQQLTRQQQTPQHSPPKPGDTFRLKISLANLDGGSLGDYVYADLPTLNSRTKPAADLKAVAPLFAQDFFLLGGQICELWGKMCLLLPIVGSRAEHALRWRTEERLRQKWQAMVVRTRLPASQLLETSEGGVGETHLREAEILRRTLQRDAPAPITEIFLPAGPEHQPLIFEQTYTGGGADGAASAAADSLPESVKNCVQRAIINESALAVPKAYTGVHLFVLVHGFQGNSYDMRLFQNIVSLVCPGAVCLCSSANEDNTEGDIDGMGARLAEEIDKYIASWCKDSIVGRISFICHSLGGVIARAALTRLEHLYSRLYCYISLSSPHLGYTCSANRLVDAGMWVLKKWRKSECLQQLTLSDSTRDPRNSFVYKLAENSRALGHFKHVCLLSSFQDHYVPFESARIETSQKMEKSDKTGAIYGEMARNIVKHLRPEGFRRLDVNFKILEKSIDSFIGRAAHIQFLENQLLMRMLTVLWSDLFS